jgi:hypothetical protein
MVRDSKTVAGNLASSETPSFAAVWRSLTVQTAQRGEKGGTPDTSTGKCLSPPDHAGKDGRPPRRTPTGSGGRSRATSWHPKNEPPWQGVVDRGGRSVLGAQCQRIREPQERPRDDGTEEGRSVIAKTGSFGLNH